MLCPTPHHWAKSLFGHANLGDQRRTKRLVKVAADLAQHTGKSLVKSRHSPADIEGAYRLIRNEHIDYNAISEAGFQTEAAQEARQHDLLLALEDTTSLSFAHQTMRDELGHVFRWQDSRPSRSDALQRKREL